MRLLMVCLLLLLLVFPSSNLFHDRHVARLVPVTLSLLRKRQVAGRHLSLHKHETPLELFCKF